MTLADDLVRDVAMPFILSRLLMFAVAIFANSYLLPWAISHDLEATGPDIILQPWNRFDVPFVLDIAQHGYGDAQSATWAIFPLFPLVVFVVANAVGGSVNSFLLGAMIVSNLAAAGATVVLYILARDLCGREVARRASLYFIFAPFGFYLAAPTPDALFVLLALGTLLAARRHRWLLAGMLGALAAATRPPGVLLALVIVTEFVIAWRLRRATKEDEEAARESLGTWRALLALVLVPLGLGAFIIAGTLSTGQTTATQQASADAWGRDITDPIGGVRQMIDALHWGEPASYLFSPVNLLLLLAATVVLIVVARTFPPTYTTFTAVLLAGAASFGTLQSMGRSLLPVITIVIAIALVTRSDRSGRHLAVLASFIAANTLLLTCYVLNIPAVS